MCIVYMHPSYQALYSAAPCLYPVEGWDIITNTLQSSLRASAIVFFAVSTVVPGSQSSLSRAGSSLEGICKELGHNV